MVEGRYHAPLPETNPDSGKEYPNPEGLEEVCDGVFVSQVPPGEMPNTGHYLSHVDFINGAGAIEAESSYFVAEREGINTYLALLKWQVKKEGGESDLEKINKLKVTPSNSEYSREEATYYFFATQFLADLAEEGLEDLDIKGVQGSRKKIIWATLSQ